MLLRVRLVAVWVWVWLWPVAGFAQSQPVAPSPEPDLPASPRSAPPVVPPASPPVADPKSAVPFVVDPQPAPAAAPPRAAARSPLAWWWQHTTPVPIVFYTPENQVGLGAGLMSTWQMPRAMVDRPSNVTLYGVYTTRKQTIVGLSHELHFAEDRFVAMQELRYIDWPDRYYGIGNDTRAADREDYTDHYWQLESEAQYRAIAKLYLGLRHQLRVSDTLDLRAEGVLARERPLGVGRVLWSGFGPVALWDSRQGLFWPRGGSLLRADATFFRPAFGADFAASLYRLDLRHYQPLWLEHVLAMRLVSFGATGDAPFQLLPALGGALLFRGWFLGRLRDRVLLASELEYRVPLSLRWSVVGFGSLGRVAAHFSELSPRGLRGAGGAGVRVAVRPESRANFRLDAAYGDEFYVYFQFREAF